MGQIVGASCVPPRPVHYEKQFAGAASAVSATVSAAACERDTVRAMCHTVHTRDDADGEPTRLDASPDATKNDGADRFR